jgi:hypothetical protein
MANVGSGLVVVVVASEPGGSCGEVGTGSGVVAVVGSESEVWKWGLLAGSLAGT